MKRAAALGRTGILVVMLAMAGHAAHAQTAGNGASPDDVAETGMGDAIPDIVVTAQGRQERLQDVPISAVVVGEAERVTQNLNSLIAVSEKVPAVHLGATIGRSNELYIRGIGSGNNPGFDQSVGTFIDGIYHGRSRTNAATFLDVGRVEILKGPQSIFFGNNAIAGAVNIVTNRPTAEFGGSARGLYGDHGQYVMEGVANVPLGSNAAVRGAITFTGQSGWMRNILTGDKAPDIANLAGRVSLWVAPAPNLDIVVKSEWSGSRNKSGLFLRLTDCPPPAPYLAGGFCAIALGAGASLASGENEYFQNAGQRIDLSTEEHVATADLDLGAATITSVTGYTRYRFLLNLDADVTPLVLLNTSAPERFRQFSQELRIASPVGQPLEYIAGVYYQSGRVGVQTNFNFSFLSPTVRGLPPFAALMPYLPLGQHQDYVQHEKTTSAFASLTWNISDRLKLSGGLRASWVKKDFTQTIFYGTATDPYGGIVPLPPALANLPVAFNQGRPGTVSGKRKDDGVMPSAKLQYEVAPDIMVYASYARGFKAGGFNAAETSGVAANFPFDTEKVDAYEIGLKSELFDRRLIFNVTAFRSDYEDLQVSANFFSGNTLVSVVRNAATARSQGVELETQLRVSEFFRLSAQGAYLDAKYLSYPGVTLTPLQARMRQLNPSLPAVQDLSGRPTQYAPKWSGSVTGTMTMPISDSIRFVAEADVYFSSSYFISAILDPIGKETGYTRLDGRLSLETADGRWAIDVIGKNLNDRKVAVFAGNSSGTRTTQLQQPRNVAVQLRFRW